jgi:hypothetical protein
MAQQWCVDYGILPREEAAELHAKCLKRRGKTVSSPEVKKKKSKPKIMKEEGAEPGLQVSSGDAVGQAVL